MLKHRARKLKILRREDLGRSIYWQILKPTGDTENVTYNTYTGKWACTCTAFIYGRECSHIWKCKDYEQKTTEIN